MTQSSEEKLTKIINGYYNGISIEEGDEDGFIIQENITQNKVYVYYSEVDDVIQQIRKLRHLHKGNSPHAKSELTVNAETDLKVSQRQKMDAYTKYLRSDEWKVIKGKVLVRDGFQCTLCGSREHLEVHHKNYRELFAINPKTDLDDYRTECHRCHRNQTELIRKKRSGVYC